MSYYSPLLDEEKSETEDEYSYYPGLVNVSGTYCFMNSTIQVCSSTLVFSVCLSIRQIDVYRQMQALASLRHLYPYIDAIHTKAEAFDVPTPVVDALRDLLYSTLFPLYIYPVVFISFYST